MKCSQCSSEAVIHIRYSGSSLCSRHFVKFVEKRVQKDLKKQFNLQGSARKTIAVAVSGGKDSAAALHIMTRTYKKRRDVSLVAVLIDEGISGYRDRAIPHAERLCASEGVPLEVFSFKEMFGQTLDSIVPGIREKTPCSYCGVLRRRALNVAARKVGASYLATGINLDDVAQSFLMNISKGDVDRLARMAPHARVQEGLVPRILPMRTIPEKECYLYAHLMNLDYYHGECPYAEQAQRNTFRKVVYELEDAFPGTRYGMLSSLERISEAVRTRGSGSVRRCSRCGEPSSEDVCEVCRMLQEFS